MQCNAFGLIYTGSANPQMRDLTFSRSVAAVPFAGRYRCIDFILSCMVNSGVSNVGVIAEKNYHSLMDHLGSGKEWDLHRKRDGLFILPPFVTRDSGGIYRGTVDALRSALGYVRRCAQNYVILADSYILFNTTFDALLAQHIETGADITLLYRDEPEKLEYQDLRLTLDEDNRVTDLRLDPYRLETGAAGCGVYVMEKNLLEYLIENAAAHGEMDFIRDVLLKSTRTLRLYGCRYDGYLARITSTDDYFRHNMEVLSPSVREELFNPAHPIYTKVKDEVPARYGPQAEIRNCLVADGCHIEGSVENCVLFRGVQVGKGSRVRNSILMQGCAIQQGCDLEQVILDKGCTVRDGRRLAGYENFPIIIRKGSTV